MMFNKMCSAFNGSYELFNLAWSEQGHRYPVDPPARSGSEPKDTSPRVLDNTFCPHATRCGVHQSLATLESPQEHPTQIFDYSISKMPPQFPHPPRCSFQINRKDLRPSMVYYKIL